MNAPRTATSSPDATPRRTTTRLPAATADPDGTSEATPHVSALAALLARQGITSPAAIKAAIESTADDLGASGRDNDYGNGLINPARALSGLGFNQ